MERAVIFTRGNTLEISVPSWTNSSASAAPAQARNLDEQETIVRIFRSLVERAAMPAPESTPPVSGPELTNNSASAKPAKADNLDEHQTIVGILEETKGRVGGANGAAARLGVKRTTLIARMKRLGIDARKVLNSSAATDGYEAALGNA